MSETPSPEAVDPPRAESPQAAPATPLLSVVIPCYNAELFLAEAVESVRAQTYPNIEVILINDGSSDGTQALADTLARQSSAAGAPPIRVIHQANAGPSAARNAGIAAARGKYIGFVDSDDRWHSDKAAAQIALMERDEAIGLTFSGWRIIREDGLATNRTGVTPAGVVTLEALLFSNLVATTSSVIARAALLKEVGGFEPTMRHAEDLDLWLRVAARPDTHIASTGSVLIDRRERTGQLTKQWVAMYNGWLLTLERIRAISPQRVERVAPAAIAMNERYCAFLAYEAGDYPGARKILWQAWMRAPAVLASRKRSYPTTLAVLATWLPRPVHAGLLRFARGLREGRKL